MSLNPVTLSFIVPAYNEQNNLPRACETILRLASRCFREFEIIIVDDASTDGTWQTAQQLAKDNVLIRVFRNVSNRGLGFTYYYGIEKARYDYVMLVPGDNEVSPEALEGIFHEAGKADVLVTHIANRRARPLARQVVSRFFTLTMNLLFGLKLHYYNGINVIRTDLVKQCPHLTDGFAYMALILVRLLRDGRAYSTVGFMVQKRNHGKTKAFRLKNVISVLTSVATLWKNLYVTQK